MILYFQLRVAITQIFLFWIFFVFGDELQGEHTEEVGCQWISKHGHFVAEGHRDDTECFDSLEKAKSACEDAGDCFAIASQTDVCDGKYRISHGVPTFLHFEAGLAWHYRCSSVHGESDRLPVFSQLCRDCGCRGGSSNVDFVFLGNASSLTSCVEKVARTDALCGSLIMYGFHQCFCRTTVGIACEQIEAKGWDIHSLQVCDMSLVVDYSGGECEWGESYGCFGSHMFVSNNCSGLFEHNSKQFECLHDGSSEPVHCTFPIPGGCDPSEINITGPTSTCLRVPELRLPPCPNFHFGNPCFPALDYSYKALDHFLPAREKCDEASIGVTYHFKLDAPWKLVLNTYVKVVVARWNWFEEFTFLDSLSEEIIMLNITIRNLTDIIRPMRMIIYLKVQAGDTMAEIPFIDHTLLFDRLVYHDCHPPVSMNPWEVQAGAKITNSEGYSHESGLALGTPIRSHLWIQSSEFQILETVIQAIQISIGFRHTFYIYDTFHTPSAVTKEMADIMGCCTFTEDYAPRPEGRGEESLTWLLYLDPLEFTALIADHNSLTMKITFCTLRSESQRDCYEKITSVTLLPFVCELLGEGGNTYLAEIGSFAHIPCKNSDGYALMYCDVMGWNSEMSRVYCDTIEVVLPLSTEPECSDDEPCEVEEAELHYTTTYTLLMLICILAIFVFCSLLGIFHAKIMESPQSSDLPPSVRRRPVLPIWLPHTKYKRPNADENVESSESKSDDDTPVCYICLNKMYEDDFFIQLPCKHRFHTHCLSPWLHGHTTCPTCRFDLRQLFYE